MNAAFEIHTPSDTSATSTATTTSATNLQAAMPNFLAQPVRQPLPTTGESLLLFPEQSRSQGTPCEVANMLQARCNALSTLELGKNRLEEFTEIVMRVASVRDDRRPSVIHMLLGQVASLPEHARTEAWRYTVMLASSLAPTEQAQIYRQVARTGALLPPDEHTAALRNLLMKVDSLRPEVQNALLLELAAALSSLPNADAQHELLTLMGGVIDKLPRPQRLSVAEALAAVSWQSGQVALAAFNVALATVYPNVDPYGYPLLAWLAGAIPQLPELAQAKAFRVVLGLSTNGRTQDPDVIATLCSVAGRLNTSARADAQEQLATAGYAPLIISATPAAQPAPQDNGSTAGISYTGFTDALAAAAQRSTASRASELRRLAALLADLPDPQRANALTALLTQAALLPASHRATSLGRLAEEICVLPQPERLAAWSRLIDEAGKLPDRSRGELLTLLCGQVDGLPDTARAQALQALQAMASQLAMPDASLLHALAAVIACLPKHERMPAFERLHACLRRLQAKATSALSMGLAAVLPQLPETRRQAALELLAAACEGLAAKHKPPLLVLLSQALASIPAATLLESVHALLRPLRKTSDALAPGLDLFNKQVVDATPVSKEVLKQILRGARDSAAAMPMAEHDRVMVLCAIVAGLETCSRTACSDAVEAVLNVAINNDIDAWLTVLDCAAPLLLKCPPTARWIVPQNGMGSIDEVSPLSGPNNGALPPDVRPRQAIFSIDAVHTVLRLCAILGSAETDVKKYQLITGTKSPSSFYRLATNSFTDEKNLAAFMLPLLRSTLSADLCVQILIADTAFIPSRFESSLNIPAITGQYTTCVAMYLVVRQKASWHKLLTQLVLGSELPVQGKLAALSGMLHRPGMWSLSALNVLAASAKSLRPWPRAAVESQVRMVLQAALTNPELVPLLLGAGPIGINQLGGVHKSTALLTALAVDNKEFVLDYTTLILNSALPDEFKVMLCGRRTDVNNEAEVEGCFGAASAEIRDIYKLVVRQSKVPESIKVQLLRYC